MKTLREDLSEDLLVVTQPKKRSKTSPEPIPVDLIVEILLRLSAKSIARCRRVSKLWASLLGLPYFTDLFLTRSSVRPQLLFVYVSGGNLFFFTSPQPRKHDENLSLLAANYLINIPYDFSEKMKFSYISGLVFLRALQILKGKKHRATVIFNPSTGQYLTLPKVKSRRRIGVRSHFGYDPIEKQYKALSMTWTICGARWMVSEEHQVLTLGTGRELSWRKIECCVPHSLHYDSSQKCINGVIYYHAVCKLLGDFIIVSFDVRSEKFGFVKGADPCTTWLHSGTLINYNGKLAELQSRYLLGGNSRSIKLRVLEDAEKHEWSEHIYLLPSFLNNVVGDTTLLFVGVTPTNEIVLSSRDHVFYYNTERNTVKKVGIQGMEAVKYNYVYTFLDHIENVKLM